MEGDLLDCGAWIVQQTAGLTGVNGAWLGRIPDGVDLPAIRFQAMSQQDARTNDGNIVLTTIDMLVLVVAEGPPSDLAELSKDLHAVLHRQSGVAGDTRVGGCVRLYPFSTTEIESGRTFHSAGGVYRLWSYAA